MTTSRWTIRGVNADIIRKVQALQSRSGASLGEIVSRALRHGIPAIQSDLIARQPTALEYLKSFARGG
jgi:hypothetical protein